MRIDYSEPKKSYVSPQAARPRKESSGGGTAVILFVVAIIMFGSGFGSGWFMSQRSAKKAFKAAMEQQSLENSPQKEAPAQQAKAAQVPQGGAPAQPAVPPNAAPAGTTPAPAASAGAPEPSLSFYKTLPSGQKSAVLGSGINAKDEKGAKLPLQAAVPVGMAAKPAAAPAANGEAGKAPAPAPAGDKSARRPETAGFTVQVASYSLKSEAETLRSKLAAKGYNALIAESNQGDKGIWYRVRVGKKLEQDAAKELATKLGKGALAIPDKD